MTPLGWLGRKTSTQKKNKQKKHRNNIHSTLITIIFSDDRRGTASVSPKWTGKNRLLLNSSILVYMLIIVSFFHSSLALYQIIYSEITSWRNELAGVWYRIYPKYSDTSTPYHICSNIWTSTIHYPMLCLNIAGWVANSVDPDETPRSAASHLGLNCLLRPVCPNTYGKYCMVYPHQGNGLPAHVLHFIHLKKI